MFINEKMNYDITRRVLVGRKWYSSQLIDHGYIKIVIPLGANFGYIVFYDEKLKIKQFLVKLYPINSDWYLEFSRTQYKFINITPVSFVLEFQSCQGYSRFDYSKIEFRLIA